MAEITNVIKLYNVPISQQHELDFPSIEWQTAYFSTRVKATFNAINFQSRASKVRVKGYIDTLNDCNYLSYTNTYNGTTKTYYCFIISRQLVAKETMELTLQIDVWQTWMFDIHMQPCLVEQMHVADDTMGLHTYPEDFEIGNYVTYGQRHVVSELIDDICYLLATSIQNVGVQFGKIYSGLQIEYFTSDSDGVDALNNRINSLQDDGKADGIAFIFMYPDTVIKEMYDGIANGDIISTSSNYYNKTINVNAFNKYFSFKGINYTPKNKKLLCYPYNFVTIKNSTGANVVLKYEDFSNPDSISFHLQGTLAQEAKFELIPSHYGGRTVSYEDGIESGSFGLCSWNNDNYSNWYANNVNSLRAQSYDAVHTYRTGKQVASNNYRNSNDNTMTNWKNQMSSTITSAITDILHVSPNINNISDAINANRTMTQNKANAGNDLENTNLVINNQLDSSVRSLMASISDAKVQPNTARGNTVSTGLDVSRGTNTFYIDQTQIKPEFARIVDMAMQMFGYKVMEVLTPSTSTRNRWNYIKTVNAKCLGNIPEEDKMAIEFLYNSGFTVWHNAVYMYNYDATNEIV